MRGGNSGSGLCAKMWGLVIFRLFLLAIFFVAHVPLGAMDVAIEASDDAGQVQASFTEVYEARGGYRSLSKSTLAVCLRSAMDDRAKKIAVEYFITMGFKDDLASALFVSCIFKSMAIIEELDYVDMLPYVRPLCELDLREDCHGVIRVMSVRVCQKLSKGNAPPLNKGEHKGEGE